MSIVNFKSNYIEAVTGYCIVDQFWMVFWKICFLRFNHARIPEKKELFHEDVLRAFFRMCFLN